MDDVEGVRASRWMLEAPKLQRVAGRFFVVRAVFCRSTLTTRARVSHIDIRSDGYLWLGSPSGGLVSDPVDIAPRHIQDGADIALYDWLLWSRLLWS